MRILSANLNQRIGNAQARAKFESWLGSQTATLILGQEPFTPSRNERPPLDGYKLISTSRMISCWLANGIPVPTVVEHTERWHEIFLGDVSIHNVYLSPHSSKKRTAVLLALRSLIADGRRGKTIVLGDINLAPRPADGVFGDHLMKTDFRGGTCYVTGANTRSFRS